MDRDLVTWDFEKYIVNTKFSAGNLLKAHFERATSGPEGTKDAISILIRPDAWGRRRQNQRRSWFYFEVDSQFDIVLPHQLTIIIKNLEPLPFLLEDGHVPVYCSQSQEWRHLNIDRVKVRNVDVVWNGWDSYEIEFTYDFANGDPCVWFAWSFPYDYDTIQANFDQILTYCLDSDVMANQSQLCTSLEGRPIIMLRVAGKGASQPERPTILLTARSRPGDTLASYMMDGMVDFIVSQDPRGIALRNNFNFVCLPCLNPDGVVTGNTLSDTLGQDMSHGYLGPDPNKLPVNAALVDLVMHLRDTERLFAVVDCNLSYEQKGIFLTANSLPSKDDMVQSVLYAKYVANNCAYFNYRNCDFSLDKAKPSDGSYDPVGTQRSMFRHLTKLVHIYTLEGHVNSLSETHTVNELKSNALSSLCIEPSWLMPRKGEKPRMLPEMFHSAGQAAVLSFLDIKNINPVPRMWTSLEEEMVWAEKYLIDNDSLHQWYRPMGKKRPKKLSFFNTPVVVAVKKEKEVESTAVRLNNERDRHAKMLLLGLSSKYAHILCRDFARNACHRGVLCPFCHLLPDEKEDIRAFRAALRKQRSESGDPQEEDLDDPDDLKGMNAGMVDLALKGFTGAAKFIHPAALKSMVQGQGAADTGKTEDKKKAKKKKKKRDKDQAQKAHNTQSAPIKIPAKTADVQKKVQELDWDSAKAKSAPLLGKSKAKEFMALPLLEPKAKKVSESKSKTDKSFTRSQPLPPTLHAVPPGKPLKKTQREAEVDSLPKFRVAKAENEKAKAGNGASKKKHGENIAKPPKAKAGDKDKSSKKSKKI